MSDCDWEAGECDCGTRLAQDGECPACRAEMERMNREYGWGDVRAAMEPPRYVGLTRDEIIHLEGSAD